MMGIRKRFAAAFVCLSTLAAYLGFSAVQVPLNGRFLHFTIFFMITICFYWILDGNRRRVLNLTAAICTGVMGVGSEFLRNIVTKRKFDPLDIVANLFGSAVALGLCTWYHRRMLERKRRAKSYQPVVSVDVEFSQDEMEGEELDDLEVGRREGSISSEDVAQGNKG